ncbi:hypothetical protein N7509_000150 [Penicillium cosmopolitanum]|uniref:FAD/NAD(P)-binding domain-containing protein n=1 Tax=Penicillium cosmopolitanum TaxID=1131564 RepID=A0A9W9WCA0_9EURO|nr:uncharacterized protein N7509_000150 [Penicillium cosmopolitanum]KAJ5414816.1 hypothetical protein N7509_000150 [Penicillium cosmopolitanum]
MGSIENPLPVEGDCFASDGDYLIPNVEMGSSRQLKIICIGAGASGLNLAFQARAHLRDVDLVIFEKNNEVGGTWYENRYPGCACDIPAHNYQFSWAQNPDWSHFYATAPEIHKYLLDTSYKYDLRQYVRFQHRVLDAHWDEETGMWNLRIEDEISGEVLSDSCHFLFNGGGYLNHWKWPTIEGLHTFQGDLVHTANWTAGIDLRDKKVGVIGNGSSGMQVLAAIYPDVHSLVSFSRSPTWVTPNFAADFAGPDGGNFQYSEEQKRELAENPEKFLAYRKALEKTMSGSFMLNLRDSELQQLAKEHLAEHMKGILKDEALSKALIPEFGVGCRRPTPGLGYLETLTKPNARLITDRIDSIIPEGIKLETGETIELDVIVCATGFEYSWIPRFPVTGRNGTKLSDLWKDRPTAYFGLAVQDMPNYFVFLGPNSPLSHGSAIPTIEAVTKYMLRMVWRFQTERYKAVVPSPDAVNDFVQHNDTFHQRTIWGTKCRSWLKGGKENGKVLTHPGSRIQNIHCLLNPRYEDWEWKSLSRNRFAYMGNGVSVLEQEGRDSTWYINDANCGYEGIFY